MSVEIREIINGDFSVRNDIIQNFQLEPNSLDGMFFIQASYDICGYDGNADILYVQNGKLFEVHGGHCSCYGLEGQWSPEETFPEAALKQECFQNNELLLALHEDPLVMVEIMKHISTPANDFGQSSIGLGV